MNLISLTANQKRSEFVAYVRTHPLLQNSDSLVLERLAELHDLRALRVDGQGRDDQVRPLLNHLADQPGPLLLAGRVVPLQATVLVERQVQAVGEVAVVGQKAELEAGR